MAFGSVPGKLLLVLASTFVLGYRPHWTHDRIFLPHWLTSVPGKSLLAFASTVILGSGLRGTYYHICLSHDSELWHWVLALDWSVGRVNCCWSSPVQVSLFPGPEGLVTIFFCLTTLGVVEEFHLTFGAEEGRSLMLATSHRAPWGPTTIYLFTSKTTAFYFYWTSAFDERRGWSF
jgi:hypothetical protein